jgi:hypothetical protein
MGDALLAAHAQAIRCGAVVVKEKKRQALLF